MKKLAIAGDPEVIEEARKRFEAHLSGSQLIEADLRSAIYTAVLNDCDESTFEKFFVLYNESNSEEDKMKIACSMGIVTKEKFIKRVIEFAESV